jgi:hypothetical protein
MFAAIVLLVAAYWWTAENVEAVASGEPIEASSWRIGTAHAIAQGLGLAGAVLAVVGVRRTDVGWTRCGVFAVWFGGMVVLLPFLLVV